MNKIKNIKIIIAAAAMVAVGAAPSAAPSDVTIAALNLEPAKGNGATVTRATGLGQGFNRARTTPANTAPVSKEDLQGLDNQGAGNQQSEFSVFFVQPSETLLNGSVAAQNKSDDTQAAEDLFECLNNCRPVPFRLKNASLPESNTYTTPTYTASGSSPSGASSSSAPLVADDEAFARALHKEINCPDTSRDAELAKQLVEEEGATYASKVQARLVSHPTTSSGQL